MNAPKLRAALTLARRDYNILTRYGKSSARLDDALEALNAWSQYARQHARSGNLEELVARTKRTAELHASAWLSYRDSK